MTLLGLDIETTGLHTDCNLLTLYMGIVDKNYKIQDSLDLKLKPNPSLEERGSRAIYSIQPEAMTINKIDLYQHDLEALAYKDAKTMVYQWLQAMNQKYGELTPFGNLVSQDINKITDCVISKPSWENFVDRRVIELSAICKTLQLLRKIPESQSLSLKKIAEYFGVYVDVTRLHTAEYDVLIGAEVLKCYTSLM